MRELYELPDVVLSIEARQACIRPYPGHPHGCPNYGKRETCPPRHKLFEDMFDETKSIYAMVYRFDLGAHVIRMIQKHPDWSQRQLVNCWYWQAGARKKLRELCEDVFPARSGAIIDYVPEAGGVDVTATLKKCAIYLEWPPRTVVHLVALCGMPKKRK